MTNSLFIGLVCSRRFGVRALRVLVGVLGASLALGPSTSAQTPPAGLESLGMWVGPMDWSAQLNPSGCDPCTTGRPPFSEIAHAALIPVGTYQGSVMLWREGLNAQTCEDHDLSEMWVLFPENLDELFRVDQTVGHNIFCAGHSWDADGNLVIAGGEDPGLAGDGLVPINAHRFDPNDLAEVVWPIGGTGGKILGTPWSANMLMSIDRYYPTLMTLDRREINTDCVVPPLPIPGGSQIVLGGPPEQPNADPCNVDPLTPPYEGNELWQSLAPGETAWGHTLAPAGVPLHQHSGLTETFPLEPASNPPEYQLDTYPRAFQMAELFPSGVTGVNGQIFVANDVETQAKRPQPTTAGRSWAMKPPASTTTGCWELRRGPEAGTASAPGTNGRMYGSAVLLHTLERRNRVLVFGGSQPVDTTCLSTFDVNSSVQEYEPSTASLEPIADGSWRPKASMMSQRVYANAVVLPTGKIFIEGGLAFDVTNWQSPPYPCANPPCPQSVPELYDPGSLPGDLGSTHPLAESNIPPGPGTGGLPWLGPTPRAYHQVAVLLKDGRVLVAGGDFREGPSCPPNPPDFPPSKHSGEIYYPPYLFQGERPRITLSPSSIDFAPTANPVFQIRMQVKRHHVAKVVLTRPASVTHHFDVDQRYIELDFSAPSYTPPKTITVDVTSPHESLGPPGWYMIWVVEASSASSSADLLPSDAKFILLE